MEFVTSLLPLVGVVAGAFLAYVFGFRNEKIKWERSERARTADLRRAAYGSLARSLKHETVLCRRMAAYKGLGLAASNPLDPTTGGRAVAEANLERARVFEDLLLVGSPDVVTSAREWQNEVSAFRKAVIGGALVEHVRLSDIYTRCGHSRDQFYLAARSDLGVEGSVSIMANIEDSDA